MTDLTNPNKIPLKYMTDEQIAAIVRGRDYQLEIYGEDTGNWYNAVFSALYPSMICRILSEPDDYPWEYIDPKWAGAARDKDGLAYVYATQPVESTGGRWVMNEPFINICAAFSPSFNKGRDWKDSWVDNPYHVPEVKP